MKRLFSALSLSLMLASPAFAGIFFSEAYPNPCGPEGINSTVEGADVEAREWFEITNPGDTAYVMDGHTVSDNTAAAGNRFRIGTLTVPAGGSVVFSGMSLTEFNAAFGTALVSLQYYEIPRSPAWTSAGGAAGLSRIGWLNNDAGDNLRIFTDSAGTVELSGSYRPAVSFPGTDTGQSFYWDGISTGWTLNPTALTPAGYEADGETGAPRCAYFASPGVPGASVPEPSVPLLTLGAVLGTALSRRRR